MGVAPFTGAWIEILRTSGTFESGVVAPFTGAWIEISLEQVRQGECCVAPFTGAWIEILFLVAARVSKTGRSLHGSVD